MAHYLAWHMTLTNPEVYVLVPEDLGAFSGYRPFATVRVVDGSPGPTIQATVYHLHSLRMGVTPAGEISAQERVLGNTIKATAERNRKPVPDIACTTTMPAWSQWGRRAEAARTLASRGGRSRSELKTAAARVNGRRGGRPTRNADRDTAILAMLAEGASYAEVASSYGLQPATVRAIKAKSERN